MQLFKVKPESDDDRIVKIDIRHYKHLDHGYAATIYKAQGVTVNRAYVLTSSYFDRHSTYVACTRHRESLMVFGHQKDFKNRELLMKTLSRECSKTMAVDYAQARWIEPQNLSELRFNKMAIQQSQLAKERLEIKYLQKLFPDKAFSFARAMEHVKGWVLGKVMLSDNRQMMSIGKNNQMKLVAISHDFNNHQGKEISIHLDKDSRVTHSKVYDSEKVALKDIGSIELQR